MMIGYSSTFMDKIIERANKRQERMEKIMFNYDADKELDEIDGGVTNEEFIRTCSTEKLAELLAHETMIALLENQNNHTLRMTYPAYWSEWLKQAGKNAQQ